MSQIRRSLSAPPCLGYSLCAAVVMGGNVGPLKAFARVLWLVQALYWNKEKLKYNSEGHTVGSGTRYIRSLWQGAQFALTVSDWPIGTPPKFCT